MELSKRVEENSVSYEISIILLIFVASNAILKDFRGGGAERQDPHLTISEKMQIFNKATQ